MLEISERCLARIYVIERDHSISFDERMQRLAPIRKEMQALQRPYHEMFICLLRERDRRAGSSQREKKPLSTTSRKRKPRAGEGCRNTYTGLVKKILCMLLFYRVWGPSWRGSFCMIFFCWRNSAHAVKKRGQPTFVFFPVSRSVLSSAGSVSLADRPNSPRS